MRVTALPRCGDTALPSGVFGACYRDTSLWRVLAVILFHFGIAFLINNLDGDDTVIPKNTVEAETFRREPRG